MINTELSQNKNYVNFFNGWQAFNYIQVEYSDAVCGNAMVKFVTGSAVYLNDRLGLFFFCFQNNFFLKSSRSTFVN